MARTQPYEREDALCGQDIVTDTTAFDLDDSPGGWFEMEVIAAAVVASMTWAPGYVGNTTGTWADLTSIPAGTRLSGQFTALTLTSGQVILKRNAAP